MSSSQNMEMGDLKRVRNGDVSGSWGGEARSEA